MSFRTRLTLFFVLIVVVPMIALGVVVSRLVADSEQGKANARSGAYANVARDAYQRAAERAAQRARVLAADPALAAALERGDRRAARARAEALARAAGLVRVLIRRDGRPFVALGDPTAVAGGEARVRAPGGEILAIIGVSTTSAAGFARGVVAPGARVAILREGAALATVPPLSPGHTVLPPARPAPLPTHGTVTLHGTTYAVATFHAADLGGAEDTISILTNASGSSGALARGRWLALTLLAGFLLLALAGALLVSRQLQAQLARFLVAAKRIGGGDLATTVPVQGDDEFAALGREFNKMSGELAHRMEQLGRERGRLRESIQRIGETFAAGLDRDALLEIGVQTAVDAVEATCGRATILTAADGDQLECARSGDLDGALLAAKAAEAAALAHALPAAACDGETYALAAPIARAGERELHHGLITVARTGRPFDEAERELVASLARQTGLSLENVELHDAVRRQAITDELTGLFNHRRFQEVLASELAAAQRFDRPLGLLLLDIDDFKRVNDSHGHQQGDVVLREVAEVLRACSREIDEPARYGGEEMAVALPQTDLEGAYVIAERVRSAVEALAIPRLDGTGTLHVTVSCGVAASADDKDALVADADAALYTAKRAGKNRTVRAPARAVRPLPVRGLPR